MAHSTYPRSAWERTITRHRTQPACTALPRSAARTRRPCPPGRAKRHPAATSAGDYRRATGTRAGCIGRATGISILQGGGERPYRPSQPPFTSLLHKGRFFSETTGGARAAVVLGRLYSFAPPPPPPFQL